MDKSHVFAGMLMRDASLKDSMYNMHLNFRSFFFSGKKVHIIHLGKYGSF